MASHDVETTPDLQAKLLGVLQEKTFERVGGLETLLADVRWVAATYRDLRTMVAEGAAREDLYHRLAVSPITLPPRRDRPEDVRPLAELPLTEVAAELGRPALRFTELASARRQAAAWPSNVQALRSPLERAVIFAMGTLDHPWFDAAPGHAGCRHDVLD